MTTKAIGTMNIIERDMYRIHAYSYGSEISVTVGDVAGITCLNMSTDDALLLIQHLASAISQAQQEA